MNIARRNLKYKGISIQTVYGDLTQLYVPAIMTLVNSGGLWFGGVDSAIQRVAGSEYHDALAEKMPLKDGQVVVIKGQGTSKTFTDVVFVVDDLEQSLDVLVKKGLDSAEVEGYHTIALPAMRTGVMLGAVEKSAKEATQKMIKGIISFIDKSRDPKGLGLRTICVVVYNDPKLYGTFVESLSNYGNVSIG